MESLEKFVYGCLGVSSWNGRLITYKDRYSFLSILYRTFSSRLIFETRLLILMSERKDKESESIHFMNLFILLIQSYFV